MEQIIQNAITAEQASALNCTLAEALRWAAWRVFEEAPEAKARDFGDAAAAMGLHRQGAINCWNEAKKNWQIAFED